MRPSFRSTLLALGALPLLAHAAGSAHEHGVARLDIAVEAKTITVQLESPLQSLLGFERAPRTEAERRQSDALVAALMASDTMFRIDPAAQCTPGKVELSSSALALGKAGTADGEHADIDGSFAFTCADAAKASHVDVGLFGFASLQRIAVQVAAPQGQFRRDLKRPAARIVLTK